MDCGIWRCRCYDPSRIEQSEIIEKTEINKKGGILLYKKTPTELQKFAIQWVLTYILQTKSYFILKQNCPNIVNVTIGPFISAFQL